MPRSSLELGPNHWLSTFRRGFQVRRSPFDTEQEIGQTRRVLVNAIEGVASDLERLDARLTELEEKASE